MDNRERLHRRNEILREENDKLRTFNFILCWLVAFLVTLWVIALATGLLWKIMKPC